MPHVVQGEFAGRGLVTLARVDGVMKVGNGDRRQSGYFRLAIVADEECGKRMGAPTPSLQSVDLVLLAMFGGIEEAIAECGFDGEPSPASAQIGVAVIRRQGGERLDTWPNAVCFREVYRMVAFADIERAAIGLRSEEGRAGERRR